MKVKRLGNKKVVVIAGCSKKKLTCPAPAIDLNQGQLFKMIKKLITQNNFDLKILSGKYGLVEPTEILEPYNQKITTQADIKRVREMITRKLCQVWRNYDLILVIMGGRYREVIKPFFDNKFHVVFDKRGIGGYLSIVSRYRKLKTIQLLQDISKFQSLECAEFVWEQSFDALYRSTGIDTPRCCPFCLYKVEKECKFSKLYPKLSELYPKSLSVIRSKKVLTSSRNISTQLPTLLKFTNNQKNR